MDSREQLIKDLCGSWIKEAQQSEGGVAIGPVTEQYRLHRNGIAFHDLSYSEVQTACTRLTSVLLLRELNTIIDLDHQLFWAWCGEVLLSPRAPFFDHDEYELKALVETCIRAALAGIQPPSQSVGEWKHRVELSKLVEFNTRQLTQKKHLILAYLGFPLLEGLVKKVCSKYVDYSGLVINAFDVPKDAGKVNKYKPGNRCSSLRDLMFLLYQQVADADLGSRLDEFGRMLTNLDTSNHPFDLLYSWRNQSLHGQTSFPTIGGTILNLSLLIALNQIRGEYERWRQEAWRNVQWHISTSGLGGDRSPWSYYPPLDILKEPPQNP